MKISLNLSRQQKKKERSVTVVSNLKWLIFDKIYIITFIFNVYIYIVKRNGLIVLDWNIIFITF